MNKKILVIATCLLTSIGWGQKLRNEFISIKREVKATVENTALPLDIIFFQVIDHKEYPSNSGVEAMMLTLNPKSFTNNVGFSKYIGYVYHHLQPASLYSKKVENGYIVKVSSNTTATLYLVDREKGLMFVDELSLPKANENTPDNMREGGNAEGLTNYQRISATSTEANVAENTLFQNYVDPQNSKLAKYSAAQSVNSMQRHRLNILAGTEVLNKFSDSFITVSLYFTYVKPSKDFEGEKSNKAYELIGESARKIDFSLAEQAIALWKEELDQPLDWTQKRLKSYRIALNENIINAYRLFEKYNEAEDYVKQLLVLEPSSRIAENALRDLEKSKEPIVKHKVEYSAISTDFFPSYGDQLLRQKGKVNTERLFPSSYVDRAIQLMKINNYLAFSKYLRANSDKNGKDFNIVFSNLLSIQDITSGTKYFNKKEAPLMEAYTSFAIKVKEDKKTEKANGSVNEVEAVLKHNKSSDFLNFDQNIEDLIIAMRSSSKKQVDLKTVEALGNVYVYALYKNKGVSTKSFESSLKEDTKLLREYLGKKVEKDAQEYDYSVLNILDILETETPISNKDLDNIHILIANTIYQLL
ncbi:hypothetical protein [Myroides sp.]|uniref:hypothetical protein n=1 Tax=Myroides sp. TaxID=1874736 RepID=UPI003F40FA93